jgi:hypothetical protein
MRERNEVQQTAVVDQFFFPTKPFGSSRQAKSVAYSSMSLTCMYLASSVEEEDPKEYLADQRIVESLLRKPCMWPPDPVGVATCDYYGPTVGKTSVSATDVLPV